MYKVEHDTAVDEIVKIAVKVLLRNMKISEASILLDLHEKYAGLNMEVYANTRTYLIAVRLEHI